MANKNLLVSIIGRDEHYKTWLMEPPENRNYDIILIVYNNLVIPDEIASQCKILIRREGYFWKLVKWLFEKYRSLLTDYDYFFFPDDDIEIASDSINKIFDYIEKYEIQISQPALVPDGNRHAWAKAIDKRTGVFHESLYIEVMTPFMGKEFLKNTLKFCAEINSGWGIDVIWSKYAFDNNIKMYVFDNWSCRHATIQENLRNDIYRKLKRDGINWSKENKMIIKKYKAPSYYRKLIIEYMR